MIKINKNKTLALCTFSLLVVFIVAEVIFYKNEMATLKKYQQFLLQENLILKQVSSDSAIQKTPVEEIAIGGSCDVNNENYLNPDGLQCYFYDSKDLNGNEVLPRRGIWIKPDLRNMPIDQAVYQNYFKPWKNYTSPDKSITFSYPQNWKVNELNWKDGELTIQSDDYHLISISKIENNAVTIENRISDDVKNRTFKMGSIELNGSNVTRLDIATKDNLGDQEQIKFYFHKDKYYIELNTAITGYPVYDFPIEYILSTIKIK